MECLCYKLSTRQYASITEAEVGILKRSCVEAPLLFQASASAPHRTRAKRKRVESELSPRPQKQPRKLSTSLPRSPNSAQLQLSQSAASFPHSAAQLVDTYSYTEAVKAFGNEIGFEIQPADSIFARLFLVIERTDKTAKIQQLFRRTCCYAFAKLHAKGTSIDPIILEIKNALPVIEISRTKIHNILRVGTKWIEIIKQLATIATFRLHQATGLLCLLESASSWERAAIEDRESALKKLSENANTLKEIAGFSPLVNKVLDQLYLEHSFSFDPHTLMLQLPSEDRSAESPSTSQHISKPQTTWKAPSLSAVAEAIPGSSGFHSEDANILLLILSFFSTRHEFTLDLLFRGTMPRKRWTSAGEVEELDATRVGLDPELIGLLSDTSRLARAFHELEASRSVLSDSGSYFINEDAVSCVRDNLPQECLAFWKLQALLLAYRAISWKFIEAPIPNINSFLPHLKQTLHTFQDCFGDLPAHTRSDLALTLVEASRFPNLAWKRFAIGQAEVIARDLDEPYLHSRITESKSLLARIAGNAFQVVAEFSNMSGGELSNFVDKRTHSATGLATIQHSLNCAQVEDIPGARKALEQWRTLNDPCPMEEVVQFRIGMLLGRFLRYQGEFAESLAHLKRSRDQAEERGSLSFDEDLRDLTCDLADTFRELDDPISAEHHLRAEITRRDRSSACSSQTPLQLCLAEALFAQGHFEEAEQLGLEIKSRPNLLRFEKLRTHIVLAKIYHVKANNEEALTHWSAAMTEIAKFRLTNGDTTRTIVLSIGDILRRMGNGVWVEASLKEAAYLDQLAQPGGTRYWIAGMRHWLDYLQLERPRSRM